MQDINLYHLFKFYVRKLPIIIAITVIGAVIGFVYSTYVQVPLYKSDATLLLVSTEDRKVGQDSTLLNNYIELLKSRRVLEPVIGKQGHVISYDNLVASTTAVSEKDTEVIKVSIASPNPKTSKALVDGVVTSFRDEIKKLYEVDNITVVDNANQATQPYNIQTNALTTLATAAGFFITVILLFFAYDLGIMKKNVAVDVNRADKLKVGKPSRQGGFINKIVAMLVGTEVQQPTIINDQRHKAIVITPPSEVKLTKKNRRKK